LGAGGRRFKSYRPDQLFSVRSRVSERTPAMILPPGDLLKTAEKLWQRQRCALPVPISLKYEDRDFLKLLRLARDQ